MTESNWANATAPDHVPMMCPACGAADLNGAKLTLERLANGHILCSVCSKVFKPPPPKEAV